MGKLVRVTPPSGERKPLRKKNIQNPLGNVYRKISASCPSTPLQGKSEKEIREILEAAYAILEDTAASAAASAAVSDVDDDTVNPG